MSSAPIVYVSGDGSGDFNCDGKDDQVQINQALEFVAENSAYTTVYLKGPFTYRLGDSLIIDSNTILEGDSNAVLTVHTDSLWAAEKPMIKQSNPKESTKGYIIIRGFEINGQADTLNSKFASSKDVTELRGDGYYNMMLLYYDNVEISNMYLHDSLGDGLKVKYSQNVTFYDNRIYKLGHDGLFAIKCNNVDAWNNSVRCKTNSAVRIWNANHIKIHDNVIYTVYEPDAGGPGIQIQYIKESSSPYIMDDIEVYNNTIYDTYGPGIWLIAYGNAYAKTEAQNVHIHHNIFYGCGTHPTYNWVCGIETSGFNNTLIENNVFDGNYHAAVALQAALDLTPPGTGYTTIVRNNIISNTKQRKYQPSGTGNGVVNYLTGTHSFILENNCFYNNTGGNYKNVKSTTEIYADPLFADQASHDYHLKSVAGRWTGTAWVNDNMNSPCIDNGSASSDYSNEPEDNGDRINIGRYGNTIYASKSGEVRNHAPVMDSIQNATVETGKSLTFTVNASDVDGDRLTYSASVLPSGATFNSTSRVFSWIPTAVQAGTYSVTFEVSDGKLTDSATAAISVANPIVEVVSDNRLREASPSTVYQTSAFIDVGGMSSGKYRDLMWFNVSEYTISSEIGSATLSLYWYYPAGNSRPNDTVIEVYRPVSAWNSSCVSWNNRDKGIAWKNAGGDWYDKNGVSQGSTPYATITIKGSTIPNNKYYELNVTDLVKEYASGKYENTGFFIKAKNENNNYIAFYSSDCGNKSQVPKFNVTKKVYVDPDTAVTVTRNATITGAVDNRLRQASSSTVYQTSAFIDVGGMNNAKYRDVMWFDLNGYNSSTVVSNATLSLYWYYPAGSSRPNDTVIEVYRPASAWNSSYVSWNKKNNGVAWTNAGGDWYDKNGVSQSSTPYATITIKGSTLPDNKYYKLNVTDLVKEYASGKYENTGFFIKAKNESNNYIAFYSSDCGNKSQVPKLEVVYTT
jgi:uncharacterized membrane protein